MLLFLCLYRAATIRHPYINLRTFSQQNMLYIFILFGCMTLMSATATTIQNIFTTAVLGFDTRHNADLNWGIAAGIAVGTGIFLSGCGQMEVEDEGCCPDRFFFFFPLSVHALFLDRSLDGKVHALLADGDLRRGVSLVYTSLTYALAGCVTFAYYFEAMCVIGFIRTSFGGALNAAVVTRLFRRVSQENTAGLGGYLRLDVCPARCSAVDIRRVRAPTDDG